MKKPKLMTAEQRVNHYRGVVDTPKNKLFRQEEISLSTLAIDIAEAHVNSAFTDEQSLRNWILTALEDVQYKTKRITKLEMEKTFKEWLERNSCPHPSYIFCEGAPAPGNLWEMVKCIKCGEEKIVNKPSEKTLRANQT